MQDQFEFKTFYEDFGRGIVEWHRVGEVKPAEEKQRLFFLAANGMPVSTYPFFLKRLTKSYDVYGLENRAVWPGQERPEPNVRWSHFLADYERFLEYQNVADGGLIHVGHSLGASLGGLLALKRPELFKCLVLIEPGMVPTLKESVGYRMLSFRRRGKIPHMARTGARQMLFSSKQVFMDSMRSKNTYKGFSQEAMQDYADGGLIQQGDQFRLKFSGQWEKHIFCDVHYMLGRFKKIKVPTLLLFAEHSFLMTPDRVKHYAIECERKNPNISIKLLRGVSHLAIQDDPDLLAKEVLGWLSNT